MAQDTKDPDLYEAEANPGESGGGASSVQDEKASIMARSGGFYDKGGAGGQRSGDRFKAFLTNRKTIAVGIGGVGGAGGILAIYMFFLPVFGPMHIFSNLWDKNNEPTEDHHNVRRIRIMRDFHIGGMRQVSLGQRTFKYEGIIKTKVQKFLRLPTKQTRVDKFWVRAEAEGWRVNFDPDLKGVDSKGEYFVNREGGKADGAEIKRVVTDFDMPDGQNVRVDGRLTGDLPEYTAIRHNMENMMSKVYSKPLGHLAQRTIMRHHVGQAIDYNYPRLLSEGAKKIDDNMKTRLFKAIHGDAGSTDAGKRAEEDARGDTDTDLPEDSKAASDDINNTVNEIGEAVGDGKPLDDAIADTGKKLLRSKVGSKASISLAVAMAGCLAYNVFEGDVAGKFQRFVTTLKYSSVLLTLSMEMIIWGDADLEEIGDVMDEFQREKTALIKADGDKPAHEEKYVESFANTAAWDRASGKPQITGEEIHPENLTNPENNPAEAALVGIGSIISSVGGDTITGPVCDVLNSPIGYILDFGAIALECIGTGGTACFIGGVTKELAFEQLFNQLLTMILSPDLGVLPFTPEQVTAVSDHGFSMLNTLDSRTGKPVDTNTFNQEVVGWAQREKAELREKPFMERYFAMETKGSLIYNASLFKATMGSKGFMEKLGHAVSYPFSAFGKVFSAQASALDASTVCQSVTVSPPGTCTPFENYGLQKYSYNTPQANTDPMEHEEYVLQLLLPEEPLPAGKSDEDRTDAWEFATYCMGLELNYDSPGDSVVDRTKSWLPFNDPDASITFKAPDGTVTTSSGPEAAQQRNDQYQEICVEKANAKPDLYADVGMYISDVETVDTIIAAQTITETAATSSEGGTVTGEAKELAQQLLDEADSGSGKLTLNAGARQNLQDTAAGTGTSGISLDSRLLGLLLAALNQDIKMTLTSMVRPGSITASGNISLHGSGRAADIVCPSHAEYEKLMRFYFGSYEEFEVQELFYDPLPQFTIGSPGVPTGTAIGGHGDHLHLGVKAAQ